MSKENFNVRYGDDNDVYFTFTDNIKNNYYELLVEGYLDCPICHKKIEFIQSFPIGAITSQVISCEHCKSILAVDSNISQENGEDYLNFSPFTGHKIKPVIQGVIGGEPKSKNELFKAIENKDFEAVKTAVKSGANINARGNFDATPLHSALDTNVEIVNFLLENGAIINTMIGKQTVLCKAINNCYTFYGDGSKKLNSEYLSILQLLVDKGIDVNQVSNNWCGGGWTNITALMCVAYSNLIEVANILLKTKSLDLELTTDSNAMAPSRTPLAIACVRGNIELVVMLLKAGANPKPKDPIGLTIIETMKEIHYQKQKRYGLHYEGSKIKLKEIEVIEKLLINPNDESWKNIKTDTIELSRKEENKRKPVKWWKIWGKK